MFPVEWVVSDVCSPPSVLCISVYVRHWALSDRGDCANILIKSGLLVLLRTPAKGCST